MNGYLEIDISSITIGERVRQDFSHVPSLAESIRNEGLMQPIVIDRHHNLIAGESRIRAHKLLGIPKIKAIYFEVMDESHRTRLEAEENLKRKQFDWKETVLAIDKVHRTQSIQSMKQGEQWTMEETGKLLNLKSKSSVSYATTIAALIRSGDEEIIKCESLNDALKILLGRRESAAARRLAELSMPKDGGLSNLSVNLANSKSPRLASSPVLSKNQTPDDDGFFSTPKGYTPGVAAVMDDDESPAAAAQLSIPLSRMLLKEGDCNSLDRMRELGPDSVDHIITDPPYGIDMGMLQQANQGQNIESVRKEHDVASNLALLEHFLRHAYLALRTNGYCILWCDYEHFNWLQFKATEAGFTPQRWPLIWHKTHSCSNGAAQYNFTKNHECALVLRKGNATLLSPQSSSVWTGSNDVEARALGHPFAKPFALWKWLYSATCLRGATVLDPFAGRGSSTLAGIQYGIKPIAIESNEDHYAHLVINVQNQYKTLHPNVSFV